VDNNVEACINAHYTGKIENDTIKIGSDTEFSIKSLAEMVIEITGSNSRIVYLPPLPEGDMAQRRPDVSKMRTLLRHDLVPLEGGIARLIAHYRDQKD
jgi:nucleoside-diphosphate-sugar epimerase